MEQGLTKNQIITELARSPHGKLQEYAPVMAKAAAQEPEFTAHVIAWNQIRGQVRDSKVALPVVSLGYLTVPEFIENSLAHIGMLGPRELVRAFRFAMETKPAGRMRSVRRLVEGYLREREADEKRWDRVALQHRGTLRELYALAHIKPDARADGVLFKNVLPPGSVFEAVAKLKDMDPPEAAGTIMRLRIPFLIALGALGKNVKNPDLVLALIEQMTPTELVTNTKMLEKMGMKSNPALRGAFEKALEKASKSKANVLKTTRAAEAMDDEDLREKLRGVQERQLQKMGGVEGNWLVLGDRSGSMRTAIAVAREVAGTLAKMVKGRVWLVFFDTTPITVEVTGLALDQIKKATEHIGSAGGTAIGCGLQRMLDEKVEVDGIAIVSDAQENSTPRFVDVYKRYAQAFGKEVPVYLYRTDNESRYFADVDLAKSTKAAGIDLQEFDLTKTVDYYSLPNLVQTMRTNRYSLIDEIMATPLVKLADVLKTGRKEVEAIA